MSKERMSDDLVVRGISPSGHIRALACLTTNLVNDLQEAHHSWPVASAALGRTASIAAMMATMLKGDERLTLQLRGDGPLGGVTVDANSVGHVRGYVQNPHVHLPANALGKLDVGGGIGQGMLYVMRDMGLKDVYRGSVEIQSGEIADDFTYYFAVSEQTPSSVGAGVLVDIDNSIIAAGGFIIQMLPGYTEDDIQTVERQLAGMQSVTDILQQGADAQELLELVCPGVEILDRRALKFQCTCSRDRLAQVLRNLGKSELQKVFDEDGQAEIVCHFCNHHYAFDGPALQEILDSMANGSPGDDGE